jgi:hypothetical protein
MTASTQVPIVGPMGMTFLIDAPEAPCKFPTFCLCKETEWKFAGSLHTPANAANNPASITLTGSSRETGSSEQRPTTGSRLAGRFQRSLFGPHRLGPVLQQLPVP